MLNKLHEMIKVKMWALYSKMAEYISELRVSNLANLTKMIPSVTPGTHNYINLYIEFEIRSKLHQKIIGK